MSADFSKLESIDSQLREYDLIKVPVYQRSYSWERDYVEVFWNDIKQSIAEGRDKYFIGPIITKTISPKKVELIDGQQRLTTSLILLSIIRRKFYFEFSDTKKPSFLKMYQSLVARFLKEDAALGKDGDSTYEMNNENHYTYSNFIVKDSDKLEAMKRLKSLRKNDSNYKILDALLYLWDQIDEYCGSEFCEEKLRTLVQFILENLQVLNIRVADEADAFLIFETINDRGKELDTMDLVKNLVFSKAGKDFEIVKDNWVKLTNSLSSLETHSDFLSQFWTSQYGPYPKSSLFKLIREHVNSAETDTLHFSNQIMEAAKSYVAINNLDSEFWKDHNKDTLENLEILRGIGAKAINPIVMAALEHFDANELCKLIRYLKVYQFRYVIISENHTGKYSSALAEIPPLIRNGKINKAIKVARKLKELGIYVTDSDFRGSFEGYVESNTKRAKIILCEIEKYLDSDKVTNPDGSVVNIEHLMPQTPGEFWPMSVTGIASEDYESWCYRLGNLCLSNTKLNREAKNSSFEKKKSILLKSSQKFSTTSLALGYTQWNKSNIIERQALLADYALKTWSIDFN